MWFPHGAQVREMERIQEADKARDEKKRIAAAEEERAARDRAHKARQHQDAIEAQVILAASSSATFFSPGLHLPLPVRPSSWLRRASNVVSEPKVMRQLQMRPGAAGGSAAAGAGGGGGAVEPPPRHHRRHLPRPGHRLLAGCAPAATSMRA